MFLHGRVSALWNGVLLLLVTAIILGAWLFRAWRRQAVKYGQSPEESRQRR